MQRAHVHPTPLQVERIVFFSDAVFAIAITLLVIEIKVPQLEPPVSEMGLLTAVFHLLPKFMGFVISFVIVGLYWTRHHFIFGHVVSFTSKLLWLNLFLLLSIALMPFSTGLLGEYSTPRTMHLRTPLIVYVLNISFTGLMNFLIASYIGNPANGVADGRLDREAVSALKTRAALVPAVFMLAIPVAFINGYLARYVPVLVPLTLRLLRRRRPAVTEAPES